MNSLIAFGIVVFNVIILIRVSFFISSRIDAYFSKKQTKEKQVITKDNKSLFSKIMTYISSASIIITLSSPFFYIARIGFRFLFPLPIKGTVTVLLVILYFNILFLIYFVLVIYAWRWLTNNINISGLKIKKNKINDKQKSILKADPKTQRIVIISICIFVIFIMSFFVWVFPELDQFLRQKEHEESLRILSIALAISFLFFLPLAAYLYYVGNRILKIGQFPWPGAKVWRDTEITAGEEAHRIGRVLKTGSFSLALTSLCCSIYFYYSFDKFVFIIKKIIVFTKGIF